MRDIFAFQASFSQDYLDHGLQSAERREIHGFDLR
jgi:hypothetical protein